MSRMWMSDDEIDMLPEIASSAGRNARISQEESLAAQAAAKISGKATSGRSSKLPMILLGLAVVGGAIYLIRRRS